MSDDQVFISYAREDRDTAQALASALGAAGVGVWWDRDLVGGDDFTAEIERRLDSALAVVVLWSVHSVHSGFVRDESTRAREAGKLLPVRIAAVELPLGFGTLHTLDLLGWDGSADAEACRSVLAAVRRRLQGPAAQGPLDPRLQGLKPKLAWYKRLRAPLVAAGVAATVGLGWWGYEVQQQAAAERLAQEREQEAQRHLKEGLEAHFARDPNLEVARNAYLAALRADPMLGTAHYYLAHVYALMHLPRPARERFVDALKFVATLDDAQRDDANRQLIALVALTDAPEPAPVQRGVAAAADAASAPAAAASAPVTAAAGAVPPMPPPVAAVTRPHASAEITLRGRAERPRKPRADAMREVARPTPAVIDSSLPRVAASPATRHAVDAQVAALFGSDRQARVSAATALALDPAMAADAAPHALERALAELQRSPDSDGTRQGVSATVRLLQGASPATLAALHHDAGLLVAAARDMGDNARAAAEALAAQLARVQRLRPLVYVQITDEPQRALALELMQRLRSRGYDAPGVEKVDPARAPEHTEIRVQGTSDPALARWLQRVTAEATGQSVQLSTLRRARPATDTFEVWFDKAVCVAPPSRPAGCGP